MNLVHNERAKLSANYLNGLAIAVAAVGGLAPLVSYEYGAAGVRPLWIVALVAFICLAASAVLHFTARRLLRGLAE